MINLFHPARIFLAFLILVTAAHIWLAVGFKSGAEIDSNYDNTEKIGRIISQESDQFGGFKVYLWYQSTLWRASISTVPALGKEVQFTGNTSNFDFSQDTKSFDQYEKSLGVSGQITNFTITAEKSGCDIICTGIKQTDSTKRAISNIYQKAACEKYRFVVNFIASDLKCSETSALSIGLVTGGTKDFSKETKTVFQTLGLTHLVAVSGFQVVLLLTVVESVFTRIQFPRWSRFFLAILAIIGLILLVGPQPPVLRSSISVLLSQLVLIFFGRKVAGLRLLIYSACILLFINPGYIFSISFQLSFLATLGLIASSGVDFYPLVQKSNQFLKETLATTVFTFLYTLPIIVNLFGKISLLSIASNILLLPIIPLLTFGNLFGLIPVIGDVVLIPVMAVQAFILELMNVVASSPFFKVFLISFDAFSWWEVVLYYLCLIFIPLLLKKIPAQLVLGYKKL